MNDGLKPDQLGKWTRKDRQRLLKADGPKTARQCYGMLREGLVIAELTTNKEQLEVQIEYCAACLVMIRLAMPKLKISATPETERAAMIWRRCCIRAKQIRASSRDKFALAGELFKAIREHHEKATKDAGLIPVYGGIEEETDDGTDS